MSHVAGRPVKLGVVLVGLVCGVSSCASLPGGGGPTAAGGGAATVTARPAFPENIKKLVLKFATENGTAPAGGRFTEYDGAHGPELIWVSERTGDLCVASETVTAGMCQTAKRTAEAPVPGVDVFEDSGLTDHHGESSWAIRLVASGEAVDHLSCQGKDFPVLKVYSADLAGALRTVYTVAIPRNLQGEYKVAVRRGSESAEERLDLNMDKVGPPAQC
ncbi:Lipoprotein OS=Kitasatospora aureofaciens OX=1894 GN=GCM10010502_25030 PE=4 SV=1 [Kitasatospora aureofaciens]|uniref:Lipoprotein n=1 Tax=Kitasatospora aureofaciens TaxID=1894 RepID=A0A8H9HNH6_KITAU|nr:hypothetical protein [Kitasatospora aureofaciens]GGU72455.1 hypothetical protein GCM10010502_25030 [Kitasatospora aureofaciens]